MSEHNLGIERAFGGGVGKPMFWIVFGLMGLSVLWFFSLPMLQPTHPMHEMLYSARWILFPHIAAGMTALVIGPLQFSRRLRQRNLARHRLLGKIYVGAVVIASVLALPLGLFAPGFFPAATVTQSCAWLLTTGAAFLTARNGHSEPHRRWMTRSYAVGSVLVWGRFPEVVPAFAGMSLEAHGFAVLLFSLSAIMAADVVVDWRLLTVRR